MKHGAIGFADNRVHTGQGAQRSAVIATIWVRHRRPGPGAPMADQMLPFAISDAICAA